MPATNPNWKTIQNWKKPQKGGDDVEFQIGPLIGSVYKIDKTWHWYFSDRSADFAMEQGTQPTKERAQECVEDALVKLRDLITKSFEQKLEP